MNSGRFKPGQSGNPGGIPKLPESLRGIAALSPREMHRLIAKYARMSRLELQEALSANQSIPAIEAAWAAQIIAAAKGDGKALDRIMMWAVGAPVPVEDSSDNKVLLEKMTTAELLDVVRKSIPAAQDLPQLPTGKKED